jgi:hypothetical protein
MREDFVMNDIVGKVFVMDGIDLKTGKQVEKFVRVTSILDGPGSDRRDYCTIEGFYDWELDMPLENFLKQARTVEEDEEDEADKAYLDREHYEWV